MRTKKKKVTDQQTDRTTNGSTHRPLCTLKVSLDGQGVIKGQVSYPGSVLANHSYQSNDIFGLDLDLKCKTSSDWLNRLI